MGILKGILNSNFMNSKSFYITSPIYYVNDAPHIGHAYTSIACDTIARFKRLNDIDTFFLTGTDEHGQKVEKSALNQNKDPQSFCDEVSLKFREMTKILNLTNDDFIRTTEIRHKNAAQAFWKKLLERGFIYKGEYEGWYSVRDEAFYNEDELINGKAPTGAEVSWHKEESYFFKLSAFQEKLLTLYEAAPDFIRPKSRYNEVLSFVKSGLKDLSISRTSFSWGVKVPDNEKHVMYVWLDALTNYISALDFPDVNNNSYQKFWQNPEKSPLHIVGKDIIRFHAVYWPAFLMAAGINLPYGIYAHGWWTNEGQKISKSIGNVINPIEELKWLESFGLNKEVALDYFRYFLLREIPFGSDGDYSRSHLVLRINSELANNIGNLAQRVLTMVFKQNSGRIVDFSEYQDSKDLLQNAYDLRCKIEDKMEKIALDQAIGEIIILSDKCNEFINLKAPWNLKKNGEINEMNLVLSSVAEVIRVIAIALLPFVPNLANRLLDILNIDQNLRKTKSISAEFKLIPSLEIKEPSIVFNRIA